ncbi:MAG: IS110 family transposase [Gammaproteobacteria bacterium]|nr:IS110 family transposase [Gammaproteobacteria bacterium]
MALYCGIDLHSNNHVVVIIDDEDRRIVEERLPNNLTSTLKLLEPYRELLAGIVVESTFNWYWLVDGLMDAGYAVKLANTAAIQQYQGLKHTEDRYDAFFLAHLLRLGILPTGYIYPREGRAVRDLLRRRLQLVHTRAQQLITVQSQIWRSTGIRVPSRLIRQRAFVPVLPDAHERLAAASHLAVLQVVSREIEHLEEAALKVAQLKPEFKILQTIKGVGPILGLTIMLETGDIRRFPTVGDYSSYCRCVKAERLSNGKKKGNGNRKAGNKYLSWAFSEAAHFCVRFEPAAQRFFERKKARTNGIVAIRATAHKLARASYYMLRNQEPFDAKRLFV